ncbi:hypothetical protein ACFX10_022808 [Malus domestica]
MFFTIFPSPKTFEKYHDRKSATKLEQHDKDGSYMMVLQGTLQWQRKPKCYAIALCKPAAITQAVSCTPRRRHHQERIVTKRHYAAKPRCRLLHSTTRQLATEGKLWSKGTKQRNLVAVSYTSTPTACYHGSKSFAKILASSSAFSRLKIPDITNKEIHQWGHTNCA